MGSLFFNADGSRSHRSDCNGIFRSPSLWAKAKDVKTEGTALSHHLFRLRNKQDHDLPNSKVLLLLLSFCWRHKQNQRFYLCMSCNYTNHVNSHTCGPCIIEFPVLIQINSYLSPFWNLRVYKGGARGCTGSSCVRFLLSVPSLDS